MNDELTKSELWMIKLNRDFSNYFPQRRRRAKLLCENLGDCAEYVKESIFIDVVMSYFTSFDDAVDQISSVAKKKSLKFLIHQVVKSNGRWGVVYKTVSITSGLPVARY